MPYSDPKAKHIVVLGAGITGLQTALYLLDAGYQVTIVAEHVPGDESAHYASPWYIYPLIIVLCLSKVSLCRALRWLILT